MFKLAKNETQETVFDVIGIFQHRDKKHGVVKERKERLVLKQGLSVNEVINLGPNRLEDLANKEAVKHSERVPWHESWMIDWTLEERKAELPIKKVELAA